MRLVSCAWCRLTSALNHCAFDISAYLSLIGLKYEGQLMRLCKQRFTQEWLRLQKAMSNKISDVARI